MTAIILKVDVTNENKAISKDHGLMIKAGTELSFDEIPGNVQRLIQIGVAAIVEDQEKAPEYALEDLTKAELESFIKENDLDVEIPKKATKPEIIDLIEAALNK